MLCMIKLRKKTITGESFTQDNKPLPMLPEGKVLAKHAWPIIAIINKLTGNYVCKVEQTSKVNVILTAVTVSGLVNVWGHKETNDA